MGVESMTKLKNFSTVILTAALWLYGLSGVTIGQEALQGQVQSLDSQLNGVKGEFRQRLDRIESLINGRRNAPTGDTGYSPRPLKRVNGYDPCCGRSERFEPCCRYVGRYESCVPALATEEPAVEEPPSTSCRWGVGNCGWGARLFEN
jgi:hypothetical protein